MIQIPGLTIEELREKLGVQTPDESITWCNGLFYGEPGVGKTRLAATVTLDPDLLPALYWDVDGGVQAVRNSKDLEVVQVRSMSQARQLYNTLYDAVDWEAEEPSLPYRTHIVDTMSELVKLDMRAIMKEAPAVIAGNQNEYVPSQREYLINQERARELIRGLKDLPCNTFIMCHSAEGRDRANRTTFFPQFSGKIKHEISGYVDLVSYMKVERHDGHVERIAQFAKTDAVYAKDRFDVLGDFVVVARDREQINGLPEIMKKLHGEGELSE